VTEQKQRTVSENSASAQHLHEIVEEFLLLSQTTLPSNRARARQLATNSDKGKQQTVSKSQKDTRLDEIVEQFLLLPRVLDVLVSVVLLQKRLRISPSAEDRSECRLAMVVLTAIWW
jgi:hypothetical protein